MTDVRHHLLEATKPGSAASLDAEELARLRLLAADERLQEQRRKIPVLDKRASEAGVTAITDVHDLLPLLFAHSVYKSYPESFVLNGRWDRLSVWLDTVSTHTAAAVDVAGVGDVDAWIEQLRRSGVFVMASSGTSGKSSFLPLNGADMAFLEARLAVTDRAACPISFLGPSEAPMRVAYNFKAMARAFGRPGAVHSLEEPLRLSEQIEIAALRKAMADGTAQPSEVAKFEAEATRRAGEREAAVTALLDAVLCHRDEPQVIFGGWAMHWRLLELARERGIGDGTFHPGTFVNFSGGLKGLSVPDDYEAQVFAFYGAVQRRVGYGMSELSGSFVRCPHGVYHWPQWIIPLVLDEAGETLLDAGPDGRVRGRVAAYDPAWDGIWGGVVSGDQATVDFGACACGQPGPTVTDIVRYSDLSAAGDDKLTCGGTIDAYIRGIVGS